MKNLIQALGLAAIFAAASAFAADDVGLVNQLNGDVSYTSGASTSNEKPFKKVREGKIFTFAAGAKFRIVYYQGGGQKIYSGPASLTAGSQASQQQSGAQPQVTT